jgi:N-formylmaleamate deformylase
VARIEPRGESAFVDANGLRLHSLSYGDGPPLVIVPGITSPAITWEFVAEPLAEDFRVVVLDVRGRGLSDRGESYRLDEYAADVIAVVRELPLERPVLVGHSMGARIVASAAARERDLFGPVVAVDPPLSGIGRAPYPFALDVYVNALREARAGATADDMRRYYPTWPERELQIRADWLATCDERAVVETYANFHLEDFFTDWLRVVAPVLFVYGAESPVVPETALAEVSAANPAAELAAVERCGHMVPFENLDGFVTTVRNWCRKLAGVVS